MEISQLRLQRRLNIFRKRPTRLLWAYSFKASSSICRTMRCHLLRTGIHPWIGGGTIWRSRQMICDLPLHRDLASTRAEGLSGASSGADGYEPFDDYDIGSRDQKALFRPDSARGKGSNGASPFCGPMDWMSTSTWLNTSVLATSNPMSSAIRGPMGRPTWGDSPRIRSISCRRFPAIQTWAARPGRISPSAGSSRRSMPNRPIMLQII